MSINLEIKADVGDTLSKIDQLKAKLGQTKENVDLLKQELKDLNQSLSRNDKSILEVNKKLAGLNTTTREGAKEAAGLKAQLSQLASVNSTLVSGISNTKKELIAQSEAVKVLSKEVKAAESAGNGFAGGLNSVFGGLKKIAYLVPGIGIAGLVGLLTGPLIDALSNFGNKVSEVQRQTQLLGNVNKTFAESAGKEIAQLQTLYSVATNTNISLKERKEAVDELQKQYPSYFKNISDEIILQGKAKTAYDAAKIAIIEKAKAQAIEAELAKLATKELTLQQQQAEQFIKIDKALQEQRKINNRKATTKDDKELRGLEQFNALDQVKKLNRDLDQTNKDLSDIEKDRSFLLGKITASPTKIDLKPEKVKKDAETINDVLAKLARQIALLNQQEIDLGTNEAKNKISAIEQTIQRLVKDFKVDPKDTVIQKLFGDIKLIKGAEFEKSIKDQARRLRLEPVSLPIEPVVVGGGEFNPFGKAGPAIETAAHSFQDDMAKAAKRLKFLGFKTGIQDGIRTSVDGLRFPELSGLLKSAEQQLADFNKAASNAIGNVIGSLAGAVGEALGNALNGDGKGLFAAFFDILGSGLQALGTKMIALSGILEAIQIALKKLNPAFLLVGGIAAIAIGTAFKNIKIPGFASGVTNFGGGLAVVGERGPELVNLPRGSDVIPNHRLNSLAGGDGVQVFIPETRISGTDIVIAYNRASARNSRNGV